MISSRRWRQARPAAKDAAALISGRSSPGSFELKIRPFTETIISSPYSIKLLINKSFGARYFLSRLTRLPVIGKLTDKLFFEGDRVFYLPRDRSVLIDRPVSESEYIVAPSEIVTHFIHAACYIFKMDFCLCRESAGCLEYPHDLGCLFMGRAAEGINPRFGRPVSRQEALDHAEHCRKRGLVHMIGRNKIDSIWLNTGPANSLLTVCNCCPCCCLYKVLPVLSPIIGSKIRRMPGIQMEVTDRCAGCGLCSENVCFVDAITLKNGRALISDACRGCGRCMEICPHNAIRMEISESDVVRLAIAKISEKVDIT